MSMNESLNDHFRHYGFVFVGSLDINNDGVIVGTIVFKHHERAVMLVPVR